MKNISSAQFFALVEKEAKITLLQQHKAELVKLAKLHGGQVLINDLAQCRLEGVGFEHWLRGAKRWFPLWLEFQKLQLFKEILKELEHESQRAVSKQ